MFVNYWYLIIFFFVFVFIFISYWKKTPSGKYNYDAFIIKVPIFGNIVKKVALSKFSRVFAGLMASGVSVVESLKIVADAV